MVNLQALVQATILCSKTKKEDAVTVVQPRIKSAKKSKHKKLIQQVNFTFPTWASPNLKTIFNP